MEKILVTGASGKVGSAVIEALVADRISVRAGSRKTTRLRWTDKVQPVLFDYEDPGIHRAALDGVSGVFLVAPPLDQDAPAKLNPFIDKAGETGVRHIVFNSAMGADAFEQSPLARVEQHLMDSGIGYTILRPNFFMENFAKGWMAPMIARGEIALAAGDGRTSFVSVRDVAQAAVAAFRDRHFGGQYDLTGPEALDYTQAAGIVSEVTGRLISYRAISEEDMLQGARDTGMPESAIRYLALLFAVVREGRMARVTDGVRELTGKTPIALAQFARLNRAFWQLNKAA